MSRPAPQGFGHQKNQMANNIADTSANTAEAQQKPTPAKGTHWQI